MTPSPDDRADGLAFRDGADRGRLPQATAAVSRRFAMGIVYGAGTATGSLLITAVIWWINNR